MWTRILLGLITVAMCGGACATVQAPELRDMQEFVNQTAQVYGILLPPTLFTGTAASVANLPPLSRPVPPTYSAGHLLIHRQMIDSPYLVAAIAQALGARVYGYESRYRESPYFTLQEIQDSNAKGVEILVRVRGVSEAEAVRAMRDYIIALGSQSCPQVEALLIRYPQQAGLGPGPGCPSLRWS